MTHDPAAADVQADVVLPAIRKITFDDLKDALAKGWDDFKQKPSHVFFIAVIYPIIGLFLSRLTFGYDVLPLLFPLAAGFALLGPFAALAFYEISRRRERGVDTSWGDVFALTSGESRWAILALGALLAVIFVAWIITAKFIFESFFGSTYVPSVGSFIHNVFETPQGIELIFIGNAVGFLFALVSFAISVVSFPLLLDRDVSAPVAMVTSVKAVIENPVTMIAWAIFIALALIIGSLPALLGLAIVLPVLGHASWHLYRKLVV
ncbi:MAG TPA: DUF2189 domain-containing protein [Hyphomicrobiales bacterium]|nr:DUF2189 domain-containing protein [Hyphomicrobiales bacterium]